MKLMTTLAIIFILLLVVAITFFLYSSGANYDPSTYYQVKDYEKSRSQSSQDTLTVTTYNIGYLSGLTNNRAEERKLEFFDNNLAKTVDVLARNRPNILGLQEVDLGASRSFNRNQLDSLGQSLDYLQGYSSVNWDKRYVPFPYWPPKYHFGRMLSGQGILSDFEIVDSETIILEKPGSRTFITNAFYIDRLIQRVELQLDSGSMMVMNLHLEAWDQQTRIEQAKVAKELFEKYSKKMPVLLIGDFNSTVPGGPYLSQAIEVLLSTENLASAINLTQYQDDPESYFTFDSRNPEYMIDFIFYNPSHIRKISSRVLSEIGEVSDHLPVEFVFEVK